MDKLVLVENSKIQKLHQTDSLNSNKDLLKQAVLKDSLKNRDNLDELDSSHSLTRKNVRDADAWFKKHFQKYHKKRRYWYQGAIGVSNYYIKIQATSIGVGINAVCEICEKEYNNFIFKYEDLIEKYEKADDFNKKKISKEIKHLKNKIDKVYKNTFFIIKGIDD